MNRETWGWAAMVVAFLFAVIGVNAGLSNDHGAGVSALVVAFVALGIGMILLRK